MANSDFIAEHSKPKMVASMAGLGWLGFLAAGPLGAAAGVYAGHLLGKEKKAKEPTDAEVDAAIQYAGGASSTPPFEGAEASADGHAKIY